MKRAEKLGKMQKKNQKQLGAGFLPRKTVRYHAAGGGLVKRRSPCDMVTTGGAGFKPK